MATNFPTSLDTLSNVQDGVDYPKAADINNLNDAVEALQAKVGINNSEVTTSLDYIIKNNIWPIGSVYISVVETNPATLMGFGTWTAFGVGKTLIGLDATDADFDTAEETGGAKTISLAETNLPAHVHTVNPPATATGGQSATHTHNVEGASTGGTGGTRIDAASGLTDVTSVGSADHTHTVDIAQFNSGSVGSGTAKSVMNPFIITYMWKRTA